ncbi:MAG TPA: TetR/AcrR family transcriptional regulator [Candidatus Acidoferrales bacterium]|nr:TetR/AcrR family transcriptional regulator [Candidatus Acidoferrales bacterium]
MTPARASHPPAKAARGPRSKSKHALSTQEARTAATRQRLLAAAETVFARDGFEAARLEDIAALAGYTRGAFYAHFEGKEDIFFALLERWVAERIAEVNAVLEKQKSPQARLRALRDHYTHSRKDRRLVLLSLEFKLLALRHPETHARLRARHERLRACGGDFVRRVSQDLGRTLPIPSNAAAAGLGALSNALVLENLFDQTAISDHDIRHLLGVVFDAILGATATG